MVDRDAFEKHCMGNHIGGSNPSPSVLIFTMTVEEYYAKQKSPQKEICNKLRAIIKHQYPNFEESMLWGVPVFNDGLFYIVALKDHVNLGFTTSDLSKEEERLFDGGGKTTRKIEISKLEEIEEGRIREVLEFVEKRSQTKS